MVIKNMLSKASIGGSGIVASISADSFLNGISENSDNVVGLCVQLLIGISTLIGLFRKRKK